MNLIRVWHSVCTRIIGYQGGPRDDHTKWSKSDRERQIPRDHLYVESKKNGPNELIYKTETDSQT